MLTFDFYSLRTDKVATIDVYITFFVMLMYYFMYKVLQHKVSMIHHSKRTYHLALPGISMGLGIASKWTGIYAGAGLAVGCLHNTFTSVTMSTVSRFKTPNGETNRVSHKFIIDNFLSRI